MELENRVMLESLKKLCGKGNSDKLRSNVFVAPPLRQACTVSYTFCDQAHSLEWDANSGAIRDLSLVDIFDAEAVHFYLNSENHISYAQKVLRIFDYLVQVCARVKAIFQSQKDKLFPRLPELPSVYQNTKAGHLFMNLKADHGINDIELITSWNEDDEAAIKLISERLKTNDPKQLAAVKRRQKKQLDEILKKVRHCITRLNDECCGTIIAKRIESVEKRKIATEGVKRVITNTKLDGVASETWQVLWEAARRYSEQTAYKNLTFPRTEKDDRCVLCQQILDEEGKKRLSDFESFVKGEVERVAKNAEAEYLKLIDELPVVHTEESISTECEAAGIGDSEWQERLHLFWKSCRVLIANLKNPDFKNYQESTWTLIHGLMSWKD